MAEETEKIENTEAQEETQEETKEETRESVISKIGNKIKAHFSKEESEEKIDVPQDFYDVAQTLGWSDDEIMDFVMEDGKPIYSDEELLEMLPMLKGEDSTKVEDNSDKVKEPEPLKDKVNNSQEDEKIQKLLDRIDALEKAQGKQKKEDSEREVQNLLNRASKMFDETSKEFEVFGVTEKLPKFPDGRLVPNSPQMKARQEVWDLGIKLYQSGVDFDNAMSASFNAYKGKHLGKNIERNIIKDLKSREKKLSGKRINHDTTATDLSPADVIREVAKKHGRDIL